MKQTTPQTLMVGTIPVTVTRKPIRHVYLRVQRQTGLVTLSAPMAMPDREIIRFITQKTPWILAQRAKPAPPDRVSTRTLIHGDTVTLWDTPYRLTVHTGTRYALKRTDEELLLTAPKNSTPATREAFLRKWARTLLCNSIEQSLAKWEPATGLHAAAFKTKDMKTRWGTCNVQTKTLWLNLQLVKFPPACLDYVVLHELLHLAERNHNKRFYALLSRYMPDWKHWKSLLSGRT